MRGGDVVDEVRAIAAEFGVSERTVYRWFQAMRIAGDMDILDRQREAWRCDACHETLPGAATIRRRYCNGTCRQAANREQRRRATHRARPRA
jgi:hypothetical protein